MNAILYPQETHFDDDSFPFIACHYQQKLEGENHYHDFYELVIVLNGSGQHITAGKGYSISRGDVFVIKPFVQHTYKNIHDLEIENILFVPEKLNIPQADIRNISGYFALFDAEPMLREKHDFKSRLTLTHEQLAIVTQIIIKLHSELKNKDDGFRFMIITYFMQLIGYLSRCYSHSREKHSQKLLQISSMIDFIETNYHNHVTLNKIAAKGNISGRTADRIFKEALKMSPIEYLLKVRINNAKNLLKNQQCTVSEAAFQSGFNDSNYFTKQFKKFTAISPRKYKKLHSK
jgi:AraC family L-rhamnose operon transcriptional activator RhaR/AraC family L-rhamnose operon regulatory protein RhaS